MNTRSRLKVLAACVASALAQMAWADSANGVDTVMGNVFNSRPVNTSTPSGAIDPEGMGTREPAARTPSGQMYNMPLAETEAINKSAGGWEYFGHVEVGALSVGGDKQARDFKRYKDVDSGLYLNNFGVTANKKDSASFFEATGGGVGKDDQFYSMQFGRYNDWKIKGFYNETVHVFTSTYRNLWSGTGTGNLTLNGLPAGGAVSAAATDIAIGNAVLATPNSELSLIRKKGGARLDLNLTDEWKAYASYSDERRKGSRPFGLVMGGGGGTGGVEIPESIDYTTRDLMAGLSYVDKLTTINLQLSASFFRNNIGTMTVDNPMFLAAANGIAAFPRAVFDLVPNNDSYNVKGEFSRALPDFYKGRITGLVSLTSNRQNDNLIPSTSYAGGTVNGVVGGSWDTTASLSKQSAGAKIDTRLLDFGLSLQPTDKLDVKGKLRHYETRNSTEYWACNPLTGQWGRMTNDGSGSASPTNAAYLAPGVRCNVAATAALGVVPSAGNNNIRNIPYEYKQTNYTLAGDYRLGHASSVNANYERETFDRKHRERAETWEDKFKLGYVNRGIADATLRLSGEHDRRRGSTYIPDPYDEFYSASLGPGPTAAGAVTSWIHVNSLHRKFDLADRDQTIFNARLNYMLRQDLDAGVALQLKDAKFPDAAYGRGSQKQNSLNFDLSWQPSSEMSIFGYYSYANGQMKQKGLQQNACAIGTTYNFWSDGSVSTVAQTAAQLAAGINLVSAQTVTAANWAALCGTASATSPLYPTSRSWDMTQSDHNDVFGLGLKYDFGKAKLDMDYTFSVGTTGTKYNYNAAALGITTSGAPTAAQLTTVGLIGSGFADLKTSQHVLNASLLIPMSKASSVRLLYRYEAGKIRDWHYDGVSANPTPAANQQTYLDSGPQDYRTNTFGVLFNFLM
ncbi:MAG: MtrB/PioB family outer membrane beta-barrel protein [Sulfuritalea sp.]|nr:MtrB/PioB family outer membrane beta-barrel protein [Sulfuritalea sp.]MDP1984453.1 MtrB/PioB family outer membrane beta-barrel protein [Sulfuritalea sp.]